VQPGIPPSRRQKKIALENHPDPIFCLDGTVVARPAMLPASSLVLA